MSAEEQFAAALREHGLEPKSIIADGKLHRFDTAKAGKKSGWYVLYTDGVPAGAFGDWSADLSTTWCGHADGSLSPEDRAALREQVQAARAAAQAVLEQEYASTAGACAKIWEKARHALADNPYCLAKGIKPIGLREFHDRRTLLVPVRDEAGKLWSLQFIDAQGGKRFKTHGRVQGGYYAFGGAPWACPVTPDRSDGMIMPGERSDGTKQKTFHGRVQARGGEAGGTAR